MYQFFGFSIHKIPEYALSSPYPTFGVLYPFNSKNQLPQQRIADAPAGEMGYESKKDIWFETARIPCDIKSVYEVTGYIKWTGEGDFLS